MVHICICAFCTVAEPLYSISGSGLLTKRCTVLFNFGMFGMVHMPSIASMLEVLVFKNKLFSVQFWMVWYGAHA